MLICTTRSELAAALSDRGGVATRAVVMTMGALHAGHLELVAAAREAADQVIVTIFVNPLQFGPTEDLAKYPRPFAADCALLTQAGVDVVFAPPVEEMYPSEPIVRVSAGNFGTVLEGAFRPGHFDGVLTVVLKLLQLTAPDLAFFGEKDAQQLLAVRRMVTDFNIPVEVRGVPIVRDADGLALSSRNIFLTAQDRARALVLSAALRAAREAAAAGASAIAVREVALGMLKADPGVDLNYLALVDPTTVNEVAEDYTGSARLLVAARVGTTRLLDTTAIELTAGPTAPQSTEPTFSPGGTQ